MQDADEYFRLVRAAILHAEHTVFIVAWDVAGTVDLAPSSDPGGNDGRGPTRLAELLDFVAQKNRDLHVYVLTWDYAAVYAFERDPLTKLRLGWKTHRRVHFRFDGQHPFAASQHQKLVVVDDRLAFSGGLDLTEHRWDTSEHKVDDPLRHTPLGKPYTPFHDVQAMVEGPVAAALGAVARERWQRVSRKRTPRIAPASESRWPEGTEPDLVDVDVAIARTQPRFRRLPEVRECERLFLDSIAAARRSIYVENQYFTSPRLGEAFAARLAEPDGPEIVVMGPAKCSGWLEEHTMGALRHAVFLRMLEADRHGRLRLLQPVASVERDVCVFVHAKVMVVDDELLRIGSANLSNRSMGLDSECDLAVEARGDARIRAGIARMRDRLIAEHCGVRAEEVAAAIARTGSLRAAIEALTRGDRRPVPIEIDRDHPPVPLVRAQLGADPSEPMRLTQAIDRLVPEIEAYEDDSHLRSPAVALALTSAGAIYAALSRATGRVDWITPDAMRVIVPALSSTPNAALFALVAHVVAAVCFVPLGVLVVLSSVFLGFTRGALVSLIGAIAGASIGYALGRLMNPRWVTELVGDRAPRLWRTLQGRGFVSVAVLRVVPTVPATAVNLVCGAARVHFHQYLLGTILGFAPVIALLAWLGHFLGRVVVRPRITNTLVAVGVALFLALLFRGLRKLILEQDVRPAVRDHGERTSMG